MAKHQHPSEPVWTPYLHTAKDGVWRVAVRLDNGQYCVTDPSKYVSEASATLAAIRAHHAKPSLSYMAVRA